MQRDIKKGDRGDYNAKDYYHNQQIGILFDKARRIAWDRLSQATEALELISNQLTKKEKRQQKKRKTAGISEVLYIYK